MFHLDYTMLTGRGTRTAASAASAVREFEQLRRAGASITVTDETGRARSFADLLQAATPTQVDLQPGSVRTQRLRRWLARFGRTLHIPAATRH